MAEFTSLFNEQTRRYELNSTAYRIVEADKLATASITEKPDEQLVLDRLLDTKINPIISKSRHYLFASPFRKPPLKYGSRFGSVDMTGLFYAAKHPLTCLVECAYYRFLLFDFFKVPFNGSLEASHLLFSCSVSSDCSLNLQDSHFSSAQVALTDPSDYSFTQKVGRWAVENKYQVICYSSARHHGGVNYAVIDINAIKSRSPRDINYVSSVANGQKVCFEYKAETYNVQKDVVSGPVVL